MPENLKINPSLTATMRESPLYRTMGVGFTDRIFLIGHADGLPLNSPYPVSSMKEAVNILGADTTSPLLRGLFEVYFAGGRDIWIVAAAPMSEHEEDISLREEVHYETYYNRLEATYAVLKDYGQAQITVPLEAPFNTNIDFLGQLTNHVWQSSEQWGTINLGFIGTRGVITQPMIDAMTNDGRLSRLGPAGKMVSVFVGDVVYNIPELELSHSTSCVAAAAAEFATLPLNRGLTYRKLRVVAGPIGPDLTKEQIEQLSLAKLNPVVRTTAGKRGAPFEAVLATDNTLGEEGSDYWSLAQVKLVSGVADQIRAIGNRHLGGIAFSIFRSDVLSYLSGLQSDDMIRGYSADIFRHPTDRTRVIVNLALTPYFGIRTIYAQVEVGPSQG